MENICYSFHTTNLFELDKSSANDKIDEAPELAEENTQKAKPATTGGEATLEKYVHNLNVTQYDLEFDVDPLFSKTSAKFDESNNKGLLLNNLKVNQDLEVGFYQKKGGGRKREEERKEEEGGGRKEDEGVRKEEDGGRKEEEGKRREEEEEGRRRRRETRKRKEDGREGVWRREEEGGKKEEEYRKREEIGVGGGEEEEVKKRDLCSELDSFKIELKKDAQTFFNWSLISERVRREKTEQEGRVGMEEGREEGRRLSIIEEHELMEDLNQLFEGEGGGDGGESVSGGVSPVREENYYTNMNILDENTNTVYI